MKRFQSIGFSACLLGFGIVVSASLYVSQAQAVKFRRPFDANIGVNYGFDNGGGCTDFNCGKVCYSGHGGTDFPLGFGTAVVAAAPGTVTATHDGCSNTGYLGSTCGGGWGNHVRIRHADGTETILAHLQSGSLKVANGNSVSCGQHVGNSASSGSSTGNHLHFEFRLSGTRKDPFAGACSQSTSYWVDQGSYPNNRPSTTCEAVCACSAGQTESQTCGNCGTQTRTCGSNCQWGPWNDCTGQGPCAAGSVEERQCCDCGKEKRVCSASCQWGNWSSCSGEDPEGGTRVCNTNEPGPCAEGRVKCINGCITCKRIYEPTSEICDDIDNDCSGKTDDGFPQTLSTPPPVYAATLLDSAAPQTAKLDAILSVWAQFRNDGTATWKAQQMWLAVVADPNNKTSYYDPDTWASFETAQVIKQDVDPGDTVLFKWNIKTPKEGHTMTPTFQLMDQKGTWVNCPTPYVSFNVALQSNTRTDAGSDATVTPIKDAARTDSNKDSWWDSESTGEDSGCGCKLASSTSPKKGPANLPAPWWLMSGLFGLYWLRRRAS